VHAQFGVYQIEINLSRIVSDGTMYEAIVENGNLTLNDAKHLILYTSYNTRYSVFERGVFFDVVCGDYFEDYMKIIRKDVNATKRTVYHLPARTIRKIKEITSLLSSTRTKTENK
jgi:hypothetical protein